MFESDYFASPVQDRKHAEMELNLNHGNGHSIVDRLVSTAETLHLFATPTSRERVIEEVPLDTSASITQLPPRYNFLNYMSTELHGGDAYKTKLTLPGRTFVLEGSRPDSQGAWRTYIGNNEQGTLEHTDIVTYLTSLLPVSKHLDALVDTAIISDTVINEALWQDLRTSSPNWTDASFYHATEDTYVTPPFELIDKLNETPTEEEIEHAAYLSSVASVIGIRHTATGVVYSLRIGTESPIVVDNLPLEGDSDAPVDMYQGTLFSDDATDNTGTISVIDLHKEYRLQVERPKYAESNLRALATLALESNDLTSTGLELLTLSTALDSQCNLAATYWHAIDIIGKDHPELAQFSA